MISLLSMCWDLLNMWNSLNLTQKTLKLKNHIKRRYRKYHQYCTHLTDLFVSITWIQFSKTFGFGMFACLLWCDVCSMAIRVTFKIKNSIKPYRVQYILRNFYYISMQKLPKFEALFKPEIQCNCHKDKDGSRAFRHTKLATVISP